MGVDGGEATGEKGGGEEGAGRLNFGVGRGGGWPGGEEGGEGEHEGNGQRLVLSLCLCM